MRFLADESCDFRVVRALRAAGHDVTAVIEMTPSADDATVIELAVRDAGFSLPKTPTSDNSSIQRASRPPA